MAEKWKVFTTGSTDPNHYRLNSTMKDIYEGNNKATLSLLAFLRAALKQANIEHRYDISDILQRSYDLGIEALNSGEDIHNPMAWLRRTGFLVICDLKADA